MSYTLSYWVAKEGEPLQRIANTFESLHEAGEAYKTARSMVKDGVSDVQLEEGPACEPYDPNWRDKPVPKKTKPSNLVMKMIGRIAHEHNR